MAPYTPPDLGALRGDVSRDLRDPNNLTFSVEQVDALILEGLAELDRLRPKEQVAVLDITNWPDVPTDLQQVFLVEGLPPQGSIYPNSWGPYPQSEGGRAGSSDGWEFFGGTLHFPMGFITPPVGSQIRAWGYGSREVPEDENATMEFLDGTDEEAVRCYARWQGFEALLHDRALYQQWQTQTHVSDVSTTQLLQTAGGFQQDWSTLRKRLTRLRRVA